MDTVAPTPRLGQAGSWHGLSTPVHVKNCLCHQTPPTLSSFTLIVFIPKEENRVQVGRYDEYAKKKKE